MAAFLPVAVFGLFAFPDDGSAATFCGVTTHFESDERFVVLFPDSRAANSIRVPLTRDVKFTNVRRKPQKEVLKEVLKEEPKEEPKEEKTGVTYRLIGNYTLVGKVAGKPPLQAEISFKAKHSGEIYSGEIYLERSGKLYIKDLTSTQKWNVSLDPAQEVAIDLPVGTKLEIVETNGTFEVTILEGKKDKTATIPVISGHGVHVKLERGEWLKEVVDSTKQADLTAPGQLRVPPKGLLELTVRKPGFGFANKPLQVCYRVDDAPAGNQRDWVYIPNVIVTLATVDQAELTLRMPKSDDFSSDRGWFSSTPIQLQVFQIADDDNDTINLVADGEIRVSSLGAAFLAAFVALLFAYFLPALLYKLKGDRKAHRTKPTWNPLTLVCGKTGRASLSNFQIWLWTILVFTTSAYVWELSGELIDITNGILVLLGIAGAASVTAKITAINKDERGRQSVALLGIKGLKLEYDSPKWIDLISVGGQLNLYKFQMLLFTVLAAGFVIVTVGAELAFPELPDNLLLLMGISNGVYLGGKISSPDMSEKLKTTNRDLQATKQNLATKQTALKSLEAKRDAAADDKEKAELNDKINAIKSEINVLETEKEKLEKQFEAAKQEMT